VYIDDVIECTKMVLRCVHRWCCTLCTDVVAVCDCIALHTFNTVRHALTCQAQHLIAADIGRRANAMSPCIAPGVLCANIYHRSACSGRCDLASAMAFPTKFIWVQCVQHVHSWQPCDASRNPLCANATHRQALPMHDKHISACWLTGLGFRHN